MIKSEDRSISSLLGHKGRCFDIRYCHTTNSTTQLHGSQDTKATEIGRKNRENFIVIYCYFFNPSTLQRTDIYTHNL